jgi:hypothetical protein
VHGTRIRALVVIQWRAGLRINEALTRAETDLERRRGSIVVRHGKSGKRRQVGMDAWESLGSGLGASFRSGRCCVSSTARPAVARGHKPGREPSCGGCRRLRAFADDSRHASFVTPTLSRWHAKVSLCRSSSAS